MIHFLYLVPHPSQQFLEPMAGIYITTHIFIGILCLDGWGHRATWVHRNRHLDTNTHITDTHTCIGSHINKDIHRYTHADTNTYTNIYMCRLIHKHLHRYTYIQA